MTSGAVAVWAAVVSPGESGVPPAPEPSSAGTSAAAPSGNASANPTAQPYPIAEVKAHSSASDCWVAIDGKVYDLTNWEDKHPGGSARIIALCGTDGTAAFDAQHGGQQRPQEDLSRYQIGVLA